MEFIGKTREDRTFDAIVIGSGMSGGYAAKELCDKGVKTLVLERGRPLKHGDYPTATLDPWEIDNAGRLPREMLQRNPIIARCYAYDKTTEHLFVKDEEQPYIQEKPFDWIRSYQEGGKSLVWARGCQRWSKYDFEAPGRDGYGIEWPITYDDLAPWYSEVEKFVGWSGNKDGLEHFPDGEFLPPYEFNCVEKHMKEKVESTFNDRFFIQGRCAHLTEVKDIHRQQGRGLCLSRTLCQRGCPYGAYFSSNSSTLPWAERTGNLTIRTHSVVHSIIYDEDKGKATGVRVVDANTLEMTEFYARIVFVNAACINSNMILLNSTSDRFPNGLGNDSGVLGHYIGFHNYRGRMSATIDGFDDNYFYGRRPTGPIIPPFRNVFGQESDADFQGRYHISINASRPGWNRGVRSPNIGKELIEELQTPGSWRIGGRMSGEVVPRYDNHVRLSETETDKWGFPQLVISIDYSENDVKMMYDFQEKGAEILEAVGAKNIRVNDNNQAPGLDIHEMGGVRMGKDPKTSILNKWNQVHSCKNVFVTDGACMTTVSTQNPSLTFMAMTARAADYAVKEMERGDL
ncbi:MAG: GMC family oxidoreductase [Balneolaceae bacterium]|nr:GMC family oxidoreductase [Balneolaceae bacterium]